VKVPPLTVKVPSLSIAAPSWPVLETKLVPLLIVSVIALSRFTDQAALLRAVGRYLEWLLPGQSGAIIAELSNFLTHADVLGPVLLVTMVFFSSLAFTVLESAMAVIFHHRKADHSRHFLISVVMPYIYILCLCIGLLLVTLVSGALQVIGEERIELLGHSWSLSGVSGALLYLLGLAGEIFMLTSLYLVMPVGRLRLRHALLGGVTAALLWEVTRRVLVLFGAQVIAQYERLERTGSVTPLDDTEGALGSVSAAPAESRRRVGSPRR